MIANKAHGIDLFMIANHKKKMQVHIAPTQI